MSVYLLDNSVLQRMKRSEQVRSAAFELIVGGDLIAFSDVSALEAGYSATSAQRHREIVDTLHADFLRLELSDEVGPIALGLQAAMFAVGDGRGAGTADLLQAAIAIVHDAVIVHYDADFERLADVEPRLRQQWIVSRGSVD